MRDIFTVVKFTMKDMVKRKSFIISTLIILIFIVVGFNVPNLIKSFNGDNSGDKLLIIDSKNVFAVSYTHLKKVEKQIKLGKNPSIDTIIQAIKKIYKEYN